MPQLEFTAENVRIYLNDPKDRDLMRNVLCMMNIILFDL